MGANGRETEEIREPVADQRGLWAPQDVTLDCQAVARGLTGEATPEGSTGSALQTSLSST